MGTGVDPVAIARTTSARTWKRPFSALRRLAVGTGTTQPGAMDVFCSKDSPWKRLAAASRREKKMSHMTVGQLTPDLVMTVKIRSTYCRRFSCNGVWVGHPTARLDRSLPRSPCRPPEQSDHTGDGAAVDSHGSRRGTSLDVQRDLSSGSRGHQGKPLELSTTLTSLTGAGMKFLECTSLTVRTCLFSSKV